LLLHGAGQGVPCRVAGGCGSRGLATNSDGLLDAESLETVTASLHKMLSAKPSGRTRANRACICIKAWGLRNTMTQGAGYHLYIYNSV